MYFFIFAIINLMNRTKLLMIILSSTILILWCGCTIKQKTNNIATHSTNNIPTHSTRHKAINDKHTRGLTGQNSTKQDDNQTSNTSRWNTNSALFRVLLSGALNISHINKKTLANGIEVWKNSYIRNILFACNGNLDPNNTHPYYYCQTNGKDYLEQYELIDFYCCEKCCDQNKILNICSSFCGSYDWPKWRKILIKKKQAEYIIEEYDLAQYQNLPPLELWRNQSVTDYCQKYEQNDIDTCIEDNTDLQQLRKKVESKETLDQLISHFQSQLQEATEKFKNM